MTAATHIRGLLCQGPGRLHQAKDLPDCTPLAACLAYNTCGVPRALLQLVADGGANASARMWVLLWERARASDRPWSGSGSRSSAGAGR